MALFRSRKKAAASQDVLYSGMRAELRTPDDILIFQGSLNILDSNTVEVHIDGESYAPNAYAGQKVKLVAIRPSGSSFALLGSVVQSAYDFWRLKDLKRPQSRESIEARIDSEERAQRGGRSGRDAYRQDLNIPGFLFSVSGPVILQRSTCKILDISGAGAKVVCNQRLHLNDLVQLETTLLPEEPAFVLATKITRVQAWTGVAKTFTKFEYGCQFVDITEKEQDRLVRAIFTLQRKVLRKRDG